jgi:hypothetical protein
MRAAILVAFNLLFAPAVLAQPVPLSLDDLLLRLEDNLRYYDAYVPAFFCDEHAISKMTGSQNLSSVTDSTFRVKRESQPDGSTVLVESREIRLVNGQPSDVDDLTGPAILSGAFSGALAIASLRQQACVRYTLQPFQPAQHDAPYVIAYSTAPAKERPEHCVIPEEGTGRVFIDSDTMQITRVEFEAPQHIIVAKNKSLDGRPIPKLVGVWNVSVDYAKVNLNDQDFWMPASIIAILVGGPGPTRWTFEAHYSNFHKLEVTSRIVPTEESPQP